MNAAQHGRWKTMPANAAQSIWRANSARFSRRARPRPTRTSTSPRTSTQLKSVGPGRGRRAGRAWRRRCQHRRAGRDAAHARLSLRVDRADVLHAHASGRRSGLALDAPDTGQGGRRAAAEADRGRADHAAVERRLRLDRRLGQGREGRGRLPDHGAQGLHVRRADRRPPDDGRGPGGAGPAADGAALRHADELAAREGARHLARARHARHGLARRDDRRTRGAGRGAWR